MFTGNKDVDINILNELDDRDLINFCKTSKYIRTICNNDNFWRIRTFNKFKDICKKENQTWKEYYIYRLTHIIYVLEKNGLKVEVSVDRNGQYIKDFVKAVLELIQEDPNLLDIEKIKKHSAIFIDWNIGEVDYDSLKDSLEVYYGYSGQGIEFLNTPEGENQYDIYQKMYKDFGIRELK